jgi:hypothetical protein
MIVIIGIIVAIIAGIVGTILGQNMAIEAFKNSKTTIFDGSKDMSDMLLFNTYLENNFLRYIHKRLIGYDNNAMPLTMLINELTDRDSMTNFTTSYTVLITTRMSDELKKIFFRYYIRERKKKGENPDAFSLMDEYIAEWLNIRIRKLIAEFVTAMGTTDLSQTHAIKVNSQMFALIEMNVYHSYGMIDLAVPVKQTIYPISYQQQLRNPGSTGG